VKNVWNATSFAAIANGCGGGFSGTPIPAKHGRLGKAKVYEFKSEDIVLDIGEGNRFVAQESRGKLTKDEEQRLDALLAEADQIALLKAWALYTLNLCQKAEEKG